jgi:hypothetical protein
VYPNRADAEAFRESRSGVLVAKLNIDAVVDFSKPLTHIESETTRYERNAKFWKATERWQERNYVENNPTYVSLQSEALQKLARMTQQKEVLERILKLIEIKAVVIEVGMTTSILVKDVHAFSQPHE